MHTHLTVADGRLKWLLNQYLVFRRPVSCSLDQRVNGRNSHGNCNFRFRFKFYAWKIEHFCIASNRIQPEGAMMIIALMLSMIHFHHVFVIEMTQRKKKNVEIVLESNVVFLFLQTTPLPQQIFQNASPAPLLNASSPAIVPLPYNGPPKLSDSYLPPVMQALAYYVELIQYEPLYTTTIEPPYTLAAADSSAPSTDSQADPTTTTRLSWMPTTTTSTTPSPSTTQPSTTTSSWWESVQTTPFHKPGYFAPEQPPHVTPAGQGAPKPAANYPTSPPRPNRPAHTGNLPLLSISKDPYFDYYLHGPKTLTKKIGKYTFDLFHRTLNNVIRDSFCYHRQSIFASIAGRSIARHRK